MKVPKKSHAQDKVTGVDIEHSFKRVERQYSTAVFELSTFLAHSLFIAQDRYMQEGAEAVYSVNPDLLVIVSGLHYDSNFNFLIVQPLNLTFSRKLVFELHWYSFTSRGRAWKNGNANEVCGKMVDEIMNRAGFLLEQGHPLFVSEFGGDQRGNSVTDNRYLNCFLGLAAELDIDWALWTIVGSYYLRHGKIGVDEPYGLLNASFSGVRNHDFMQRISSLQAAFQGTLLLSLI